MALTIAATGGSAWRNVILLAVQTVMPVTAGLILGLPIAMRTRAIPIDHWEPAPVNASLIPEGGLIDTFDSIPLYAYGAATQDTIAAEYPDDTWVEFPCVQE